MRRSLWFPIVRLPRVVTELNRYLCTIDQQNDIDNGFVTLALTVIDPATKQGAFICAGSEPPLILRTNGNCDILHAAETPLGVDVDAVYSVLPFALNSGDTLLLLTDGITEARANKQFLEYEGMVALAMQAVSAPTLQEMATTIVEGARSFANGQFRDDVCLLLVRPE